MTVGEALVILSKLKQDYELISASLRNTHHAFAADIRRNAKRIYKEIERLEELIHNQEMDDQDEGAKQ